MDKKEEIHRKLKGFNRVWREGNNKQIFAELIFCILTPQSRARICWQTVEQLFKKGLLQKGRQNQIARELSRVRFKNKKAKYLCEARKMLINKAKLEKFSDNYELRNWLVNDIKGIGYKEASHFLRNIGLGKDLAILDRHILKNLKLFKVINDIPNSLTRKRYYKIEEKMRKHAKKINIPMDALDLVLWYKETGEIFK